MLGTVPLLASLKAKANERPEHEPSIWHELREGWQEFTKHAWVWGTVLEYLLANACWYGGLLVLGPVIAKEHLGGPAAWGWLNAAFSVGLILGGTVALRWMPRRPMLWVTTLAAHLGVAGAEYAAGAVTIGAAVLTLLLKDVWTMRMSDAPDWDAVDAARAEKSGAAPVLSGS
jgi:hypothetical protein